MISQFVKEKLEEVIKMNSVIKTYVFAVVGLGCLEIKAQSESIAKLKLFDSMFDSELIALKKVYDGVFTEEDIKNE